MPRSAQHIIGITGAGVVGGSLRAYLEAQGHEVRVYDPPQGFASLAVLADTQAIFVCVPTPYTPGIGFDSTYLFDAVSSIPGEKLVVVKSTVVPGTTELLRARFGQHRFIFNPEFLREASAYDDFIAPDRQIVGRASAATMDDASFIMDLLPRAPFERICTASEAEMAKYVANSFLAVKVTYANEAFDLCARLGIAYDNVRDIVAADARIGGSHLDVFDGGYRGYGGKCLPKDTKSLLDLARSAGVKMQVLAAADRANAALCPDAAVPPTPVRRPVEVAPVEIRERAA